jgi:hypothetical protein
MVVLSQAELDRLTKQSVDPKPQGPVRRAGSNAHMTDDELVNKIESRNENGKPTYLLRLEYKERLKRR